MEINIETLIQWGLTSLASSGSVLFVAQKWIEARFEKQNNEFQNTLDTKLSRFNIQFSKLHQDRAEVIKELYAKLIELHYAMLDYTSPGRIYYEKETPESKERAILDRVNKALSEVRKYFPSNKIYFKKELATKIESLIQEYLKNGLDFSHAERRLNNKNIAPEQTEKWDDKKWNTYETVSKDLSKVLEELENEFRAILGVD
ncbi:MAG TPA: hypothetical protein VGB95_05475 [Chitinophagales bacterium]